MGRGYYMTWPLPISYACCSSHGGYQLFLRYNQPACLEALVVWCLGGRCAALTTAPFVLVSERLPWTHGQK